MRTALALTHVAFEDLGTLGNELTNAGFAIETIDACTADLRTLDPLTPDLLVILGGPVGVYEHDAYPFIDAEIELLKVRLAAKQPVIGICLGAQLMAAALGAKVYPGKQGKELGWAPLQAGRDCGRQSCFLPLIESGLRVLHWHGDTFDLPADAAHLASTDQYPNQAFSIGRHALALQFHPEITVQGLERWYVGHACELAHARIDVRQLRENGRRFGPALENAGRHLWKKWLDQAIDTH